MILFVIMYLNLCVLEPTNTNENVFLFLFFFSQVWEVFKFRIHEQLIQMKIDILFLQEVWEKLTVNFY